jgi:type IV fimbrial biogenesis protein FimT
VIRRIGFSPIGPRLGAGRTLVDLLVALAIAAALVSLALPTYHGWIARQQQWNAAAGLISGLSLARSEAMKRGMRVDLCPSSDGIACVTTGQWERGWIMFPDPDRSGDRTGSEPLIRASSAEAPGVTIRGNRPVANYVSYTDVGHARLVSGALQMGTFDVCRTGQMMLQVVLANGGRVRLQQTAVPCP